MTEPMATFFGDDEFPVTFEDGQKELLWVHDDLHIPNPVSPMYADIGGWWLKCDYMFRRFGTPFASDWISKIINGYVYTAAIPAREGPERRGLRVRRPVHPAHAAGRQLRRRRSAATWAGRCRTTPRTSCTGGATGCVPEMSRNFDRFDSYDYDGASLVELAVLLEDAIDMHDRHWSIHWVLNFAQFSSTMDLNAAVAEAKGEGDHSALMGRLQTSTVEPQLGLHRGALEDQGADQEGPGRGRPRRSSRPTAGDVIRALQGTEAGRAFLAEHIEPYQKSLRLQVDVRPRVLVQDLA